MAPQSKALRATVVLFMRLGAPQRMKDCSENNSVERKLTLSFLCRPFRAYALLPPTQGLRP